MEDLFQKFVSLGSVIGLCMHLDGSPARTFGLDGVASSQEVLVKSTKIVDDSGITTPLVPRICAPCDILQIPFFKHNNQFSATLKTPKEKFK